MNQHSSYMSFNWTKLRVHIEVVCLLSTFLVHSGYDVIMISDTDSVKHATTAVGDKTSAAYSDKDQPAPPPAPIIVMPSRDHDSLFSGGGIRYLLFVHLFLFEIL